MILGCFIPDPNFLWRANSNATSDRASINHVGFQVLGLTYCIHSCQHIRGLKHLREDLSQSSVFLFTSFCLTNKMKIKKRNQRKKISDYQVTIKEPIQLIFSGSSKKFPKFPLYRNDLTYTNTMTAYQQMQNLRT